MISPRIALIQYYGRSGSTFLHTLLDFHPQLLMMPMITMQDFYKNWDFGVNIVNGFQLLSRYAPLIEILCEPDVPREPRHKQFVIGRIQNNTNVEWDQALEPIYRIPHINSSIFMGYLKPLFSKEYITRKEFLTIIHLAYHHAATGQEFSNIDSCIVLQIHAPQPEILRMVKEDFPDAVLIQTIRDPMQALISNMELYVRKFGKIPSQSCSNTIERAMLDGFVPPEFAPQQTCSIRLEDIHSQPEQILSALCTFLGVGMSPNCLTSTIMGQNVQWGYKDRTTLFQGTIPHKDPSKVLDGFDWYRIATALKDLCIAWKYPSVPSTSAIIFDKILDLPFSLAPYWNATPDIQIELSNQMHNLIKQHLAYSRTQTPIPLLFSP